MYSIEGGDESFKKDISTLSIMLGLASAGCAFFVLIRIVMVGRLDYAFLITNLLLAWVPYAIAVLTLVIARKPMRGGKLGVVLLSLAWLLFYPNSPYIFTDFIHVVNQTFIDPGAARYIGERSLLWFDISMTASFALIGHMTGLVSMYLMFMIYEKKFGHWPARIVVVAASFLAGAGMFLGRFVRLNSWDIFFDINGSLDAIGENMLSIRAILFSFACGLFILLSYAVLHYFKKLKI